MYTYIYIYIHLYVLYRGALRLYTIISLDTRGALRLAAGAAQRVTPGEAQGEPLSIMILLLLLLSLLLSLVCIHHSYYYVYYWSGISRIRFSPFYKLCRDSSINKNCVFVSSNRGPLTVYFKQYPWNPLIDPGDSSGVGCSQGVPFSPSCQHSSLLQRPHQG